MQSPGGLGHATPRGSATGAGVGGERVTYQLASIPYLSTPGAREGA